MVTLAGSGIRVGRAVRAGARPHPGRIEQKGTPMASTLTRRALRRARLGGRHTYRSAARHRAPLLIAAAAATVAVTTAGVAAGVVRDAPVGAASEASRPAPGPMPGRMDRPLGGPPAGHAHGPGVWRDELASPGGPGGPGRR